MMPELHLAAVAQTLELPFSGPAVPLAAAVVDSRQVETDDLFIALPGARVDGHDYVAAAADAGAAAAIVERAVDSCIPTLQVDDSLAALSRVARANRDAYTGELLAITGSVGKTSVKNLCRAVFEQLAPTVATAGNYNNEIGVPLTLSRLTADTRYAVVEMGATRRGDIAHLCGLARPRVSAVLNAMEAHLEGFGSVADVADIKAEIYDGLPADGVGVLDLDQPWAAQWRERIAASGARLLSYSVHGGGDFGVADVEDRGLAGIDFTLCHGDERAPVTLPLPGRHNLANALAAAALSSACGVPLPAIARGLGAVQGESGRLQVARLDDGTTLIDDSYNANPGSVRAAISLLGNTAGRRALILGEMLELGDESAALHREMGEEAAAAGIDIFIGLGAALAPAAEAFGAGSALPDREALRALLPELLADADVILVKGSRGAAMEGVVADLRELAGEGG